MMANDTRIFRVAAAAHLVAALVLAAGCDRGEPGDGRPGPGSGPVDKAVAGGAEAARGDIFQLLRTLDIMAAAQMDSEVLTSWGFRIQAGEKTIEDFLDELLRGRGLGAQVAPALIFGAYLNVHNYYVLPTGYNLQKTEPDAQGRVVHYIRQPCQASEAVEVRPWWDMQSTLRVCPDTYRPDKWTILVDEQDYHSRMPLSCDSQVGSPEKETKSVCGCGPNLIRCMPSMDEYMAFHDSMKDEIRRTTEYVVANDLPLDVLFTGKETVRDRNSEHLYRRRRIGALKIADVRSVLENLDEWPEQGQWAPRPEIVPGEHAGLLTSNQLLNWSPDRRQRQRQIFEIIWCEGRNSFGATTEKIFEIFTANNRSANLAFVHDSWERLAHTEICTTCHARLDYGFQFWMGYPDARASTHFVPEQTLTGEGTLYSTDIDDPRGTAPLTPNAFARLALAQPEYESCMTRHVVSYVLGDRATSEDREAVRRAFAERRSLRQAMRVAMSRMAARWLGASAPAPATVADQHEAAPAGKVVIGSQLRARIDEHCIDCHDDVKFIDSSQSYGLAFDMRDRELPRELVVRMADHVAYGKMPKDTDDFSAEQRTEMVELMINALWRDKAARREARSYYLGQMRALPAHQIDVALEFIRGTAGTNPNIEWGLIERAIYSDQAIMTPGYLAETALEALYACTAGQGAAASRCFERALSVSRMSRWPE